MRRHNKTFIVIAAAAALVCTFFTSCDSASSLAKNLEGDWSGAPVTVANTPGVMTTGTDFFYLMRDNKTGGSATVTTMLSVQSTLSPDSSVYQPVDVTVAARADAQGTWRTTDDDEMALLIDPTTIKVTVDPEALQLDTQVFTGQNATVLDSVKPAMAAKIQALVLRQITPYYLRFSHIDDIKVKDATLTCEIGEDHLMMARNPK